MSAPIFGHPLPVKRKGKGKHIITPGKPTDTSRDTRAQIEGRDFLKIITEVDPEKIDEYQGYAIEAWLTEMGYDWNGQSWIPG